MDVPTKQSATDAGKSSMSALAPGIGSVAGRRILGPGLGTAAGGILGSSALSGASRDRMAETSVYYAVNEVFNQSTSSTQANSRGRL